METKWISINDQLPDHEEPVLIYSLGDYLVVYYDSNYKAWYEKANDYIVGGVTHWMPLPLPPTQE